MKIIILAVFVFFSFAGVSFAKCDMTTEEDRNDESCIRAYPQDIPPVIPTPPIAAPPIPGTIEGPFTPKSYCDIKHTDYEKEQYLKQMYISVAEHTISSGSKKNKGEIAKDSWDTAIILSDHYMNQPRCPWIWVTKRKK